MSIFGESHGPGIGVTIDGFPSGFKVDLNLIQKELDRRKPGQSRITTPRKEADEFQVLSGLLDNITTGGPLTFYIQNTNLRSKDYSLFRRVPRPSQIDYPAMARYGENVDLRGSGKFSGRLTAPIVIAGALAKQFLAEKNIQIGGYVSQIGTISDPNPYSVKEIKDRVENTIVRAIDEKIAQKMIDLIDIVREEKDSIGGKVNLRVENYPAGIGDPWFHSLEADLGAAILSIPATRGVEFGTGFGAASMRGSEHNDRFILDNSGKISTATNHCGGIIGGISIGTPITFSVPIKPTASIGIPQETLNFESHTQEELKIEGRHDPCIVPRALIGIEAITAFVLLDHFLEAKKYKM